VIAVQPTFRVQAASMRRIEQGFRKMPEKMHAQFGKAFVDWGEQWRGTMLERFRGGEGALHTRSGDLKRSLGAKVSGAGSADLKLRLVSGGIPYARLQEYGGIVRPVRAKFLAIPLDANKTASGQARYPSPRQFIASHPGETFFLRSGSTLLLMWKSPSRAAARSSGTGKGAVPLWLFVKQVELPGPKAPTKQSASRLGFFDTWKGMARDRRVTLQKIARELRSFT
jgi:hypothetical protein